MPQTHSQVLMARETQVAYGMVPHRLVRAEMVERSWQLEGDAFLLCADGEHYLHYRRGEGITIERGRGTDVTAEPLWLNGSLHAAIACINGLIPIHASAIVHAGEVHAFTGPSGAGKSTLIAELGKHGLPMFCDDTLILDPSDEAVVCVFPGTSDSS